MSLTRSHESSAAGVNLPAKGARLALWLLLLLASVVSLAIYLQNRVPEVLPANALATEFSAARALSQLQVISARPHPIGSQEHAAVRDYILGTLSNLGLSPEVQQTIAVNKRWGMPVTAGTVHNVLARIKGTEKGRAILLVGHYDSVATSPGASDDGAGVVTILETARALKNGAALKHDVILLFTDGEEVGLLGAEAFVAEHPWAKDVGLLLNFEARGNSGPVVLFETSADNRALISQFAKAAPRPVANSFFYEIYKRLPNDTDFTVLKGLNAQGMNFAFINGINHYHTQLDNIQEINQGSLQHEGSYALALARHFGDAGMTGAQPGDAVYFNVIGANFINYSSAWIIPLLILTALLFLFVVVKGFRQRALSISGIGFGFLGLLAGTIVSAAIVRAAWWLVRAVRQSYRLVPWGEPYHSNTFRIGFVLLAFAATSVIYVLLRKRISARNLTLGALLWWLILSVAASVMLPGASYLFTWPLFFSLLGLTLVSVFKLEEDATALPVLALAAVPGVALCAPMIYNVFVALTLNASDTVTVLVVALFGLLVPVVLPLLRAKRWLFSVVFAVASLCFILAGVWLNGFDRQNPKINNMFYALNADTGQAVFASSDAGTDDWTGQFLKLGAERGSLPEYFGGSQRAFLKSSATALQLAAPEAILVNDRTEKDVRTLSFHISSPRQAPVISISAEPEAEVFEVTLNGKLAIGDSSAPGIAVKNWGIQYYALPAEGLDVVLKARSGKPFKLRLVDRSYGLPEIPGSPVKARAEDMIPAPYAVSDAILVTKSFAF
jgi:hypothetical protein